MARVTEIIQKAPYYDTTLQEHAKNYYRLLAVPGRVAQAREITVLQGLLQQAIKSIGDSIMSNGDIVEGCQIIVSSDKSKVTVTEGRIYMDGTVFNVPLTEKPISGQGTEIIGIKINEYIISDVDDITLKYPAQGYDNYGQTGCDRLKRELVIVVNDTEASPIATLVDGDVTVENFSPNYDVLTQTLARRTYDESGSYIVEGLKVRVEDGDTNSYIAVIEAGKAYVLGYELKIPTARRINVPRSTTTTEITASNYVYDVGFLSYQLDVDPYVESIVSVRGRVSATEQQSLQTNTDSVVLSNTDVTSITSVVHNGVSYDVGNGPNSGDCYLLRDGSRYYVKWNGVKAPSAGASYTVVYQHNTNFIEGTDYNLRVDTSGSYIDFTEFSGHPLDGTNFTVVYKQYLARKDLVYIDQYGEISVELGAPDEDGYEVAPLAPVNTLPITQITSPPNGVATSSTTSLKISVENIGLTRFTMNDIQNIVNRVKRTEYNQAVLSLNDDARNRTTINSKKGILTDPLVDFSRIDLYFNLDVDGKTLLDPSKPVYDMALDLDAGIAYNPLNVHTYPIIGASNNVKNYGRLITLPTSGERPVLSQLNATKTFLINPYSVFPQLPEVIVTPAVDSWVDDIYVQVPVSLSNSTIVNTTTSILYNTIRKDTVSWRQAYVLPQSSSSSTSTSDREIGTTTETTMTESIISEEAIAYMRQRELTVEGRNFPPNLNNIKCKFDGTLVPLTPVDGTLGNPDGTVRANDDGYVKATFMIPSGIRTGVREVSLFSDTQVDGYQTTGYTLYQSSGTLRTIQQTLTTVTTVLLQREVTTTVTTTQYNYIDPVGQTFVLDRLSVIKGVNIYFEAKPSTNDVVTLEIRNVVNGSIGSTIYAHTTLNASQVSISTVDNSNGKIIFKPTRFDFSDPVVLDKDIEYAFVVRSFSDKYRIWVSEIGGTDVSSGEIVLKNSYLTGVMMSSSNNSIWTAHQTTDVKFDIIEDIYNASGSITFNPIQANKVTRLDLVADSVVLNGTTLKWYYSINGGSTFYSITPGTLRELGEEADEIILKADFARTSSENITPLLAYDTLLLIGSSYKTEGSYVGVNVVGLESYSTVSVILNTLIPASTSLNVYCSKDNGKTLIQCVKDDSQTIQLNNGWQEVTYIGDVGSGNSCKIFIKTTGTTTSTPRFSSLRIIMD